MKRLQMPKIETMEKFIYSRVFVSFMLAAGLCLSGPGWAEAGYDYKFENKPAPMGQFESEMSQKFTRGSSNVLFGWTEIARTPTFMSQEPKANPVKVLALGVPFGVVRAVGRTVIGAYEMATFYAPQRPIMQPIEGDVV